jgi:peptidyl-prolyl cis-trans isomerase C
MRPHSSPVASLVVLGASAALVVGWGAGCSRKTASTAASAGAAAVASAAAEPEIDRERPLPEPIPDVVATVNAQPIHFIRIAASARQILAKSQDKVRDRPFALRKATQDFVERELLFQEAQARHVEPETKRVEQAYDEARLKHRDETAWVDWLKDQGHDPNSFRTELRIVETVRALVDQEARKVPPISDDEAEAFYRDHPAAFGVGERLRVAHILCRVAADATEKVRTAAQLKAGTLLFRAQRGEDFGALARQFSEDRTSNSDGGVLPEFVRGQTPRAFEDAAFALQKPGDLSGVVIAPDGLHIIKLIERKPASDLSFDDIKGPLEERMLAQKRQDAVRALVGRLRAQAKIEIFI